MLWDGDIISSWADLPAPTTTVEEEGLKYIFLLLAKSASLSGQNTAYLKFTLHLFGFSMAVHLEKFSPSIANGEE
jgi:hypothetical protein